MVITDNLGEIAKEMMDLGSPRKRWTEDPSLPARGEDQQIGRELYRACAYSKHNIIGCRNVRVDFNPQSYYLNCVGCIEGHTDDCE